MAVLAAAAAVLWIAPPHHWTCRLSSSLPPLAVSRVVDLPPNPASATAACVRRPRRRLDVVERRVSGDYVSRLGPTVAEEVEENAAPFTVASLWPPLAMARMIDLVSSPPPPPLLPLLSLMVLLTCHRFRGFVGCGGSSGSRVQWHCLCIVLRAIYFIYRQLLETAFCAR